MLTEITAKSILRPQTKIESWFLSSYAINLYRGCTHNCVYCDGRTEKYQVQGKFGQDVTVKINALTLLEKELNPKRKRKPFRNGFFMICGGISDSYQPFESERKLCRSTLKLLLKYNHPVHLLTKSTLVERDLDLLQEINEKRKVIVSFSFSSVSDQLSKLLEPGVPSPSERLKTIEKIKALGLSCGMYLMPVLPFITDQPELIDLALKKAKEAGVDFVIFSGLTLKPGKQKDYFNTFLKNKFPEHLNQYKTLYAHENHWGAPDYRHMNSIETLFSKLATKYKLPKRMPPKLFTPLLSLNELAIVILEHLDYLVKLKGKKSPYGYAAYCLSKIKKPIEQITYSELLKIKGIGPVTAKIIREIMETRRCSYYESLL